MDMSYVRITRSWWALKLTYGLLFVVGGADKFLNLITVWPKYLSPMLTQMIPLSIEHIVMGAAIFEIILGVLILVISARLGAYIAAAWLVVMALNLVSMGIYFDIAVRDLVMAVGALVLAWLTDVIEDVD